MTDELIRRILSDEYSIEVRGADLDDIIATARRAPWADANIADLIRAVGFITAVKHRGGGESADFQQVMTRDWYIGPAPESND